MKSFSPHLESVFFVGSVVFAVLFTIFVIAGAQTDVVPTPGPAAAAFGAVAAAL